MPATLKAHCVIGDYPNRFLSKRKPENGVTFRSHRVKPFGVSALFAAI